MEILCGVWFKARAFYWHTLGIVRPTASTSQGAGTAWGENDVLYLGEFLGIGEVIHSNGQKHIEECVCFLGQAQEKEL